MTPYQVEQKETGKIVQTTRVNPVQKYVLHLHPRFSFTIYLELVWDRFCSGKRVKKARRRFTRSFHQCLFCADASGTNHLSHVESLTLPEARNSDDAK